MPVPAAKSTPQKKLVSLFDADEEDEQDLFGPTPTTAPEKSADSRKDVSIKGCHLCVENPDNFFLPYNFSWGKRKRGESDCGI